LVAIDPDLRLTSIIRGKFELLTFPR